ncbi:MAG: hypothetical protein S0880_10395 [Actinomycetota bacterium]|nr:hypothetical protein [Actinomycetota bacterium]
MTCRHAEFPAEPVLDLMAELGVSIREMGRRSSGLDRRLHAGTFSCSVADRAAMALERHPCELWPDLWGSHDCQAATTKETDAA